MVWKFIFEDKTNFFLVWYCDKLMYIFINIKINKEERKMASNIFVWENTCNYLFFGYFFSLSWYRRSGEWNEKSCDRIVK